VEHSSDASPLRYKLCRLRIQESVTGEHQNPSLFSRCLAVAWIPRQPIDASCIAVRITRNTIICRAVGWLPCHPLTASPWKDLIAISCEKTSSVSARSLSPWDEFPGVDCPWVNCSVIRWSLVVSLYYRSVSWRNAVERTPCIDSFSIRWALAYRALSLYSNVRQSSRQRYPSLSFDCTRKHWWSRTLECSISFSLGIVAVAAPVTGSRRQRLHRLHTARRCGFPLQYVTTHLIFHSTTLSQHGTTSLIPSCIPVSQLYR